MRALLSAIIFLFLILACNQDKTRTSKSLSKDVIHISEQKLENSISAYNQPGLNPRSLNENGETHFVESRDWTSGFYPGCLWYMFELTNKENFKIAAEKYTGFLAKERLNGTTHDMGFKMFCSYGNGYRLTKKNEYHDILLQSSKTLTSRFNPKVGCIRSWDHHSHVWQFPVIVDNMMNLELLMWAFSQTGDSLYYKISVSHADKTMENHFRSDYSSYHVVDYDTLTGEVIQKNTHQGFSDESAWARGQAWGLYGYTLMFRETGLERYLKQAEHIADIILSHENLPADMVPYWDFNDPEIPNAPRDASAAAVISSALFELSTFETDNQSKYYLAAEKILGSLSSEKYFAGKDAKHYFLLEHSTGNLPDNSEIDEPIIYADYYFLEALLRKKQLDNKQKLN